MGSNTARAQPNRIQVLVMNLSELRNDRKWVARREEDRPCTLSEIDAKHSTGANIMPNSPGIYQPEFFTWSTPAWLNWQ
eukprot:NODE_4601_length_644_cov_58.919328_g3943_i0.p2 GENE.NODE_4601_length_644_cov_58.919328_g3943_i0~~NODE_4601_length_644_cov_58.919328_g3943_i0.p2  ORF type:complete len:79 (-),score=17.35 NODE_4601_length_644_cov_58.919328_g3943_i0:372-608(-)